MPNTGMLDHLAYKPRPKSRRDSYLYWMGAWPTLAGYQTMRSVHVSSFSKHLMRQSATEVRENLSHSTSYCMTVTVAKKIIKA